MNRITSAARDGPHPGTGKAPMFRGSNLYGFRYGKLIVVEIAERWKEKRYWLCRCDCGKRVVVYQGDLKRGRATSCGCEKIIDMEKTK